MMLSCWFDAVPTRNAFAVKESNPAIAFAHRNAS